jgi:hypothetical protein
VLEHEQGLRLSITNLLAEVGPERKSAVMPDKSGWLKRELVSGLENPPAEIDIITRRPKLGIEPSNFLED